MQEKRNLEAKANQQETSMYRRLTNKINTNENENEVS